MRRWIRRGIVLVALLAPAGMSQPKCVAGVPPEQATSIHSTIDAAIDARLKQAKVTPAEQATFENLIRRVTLDLVGRVPTHLEVRRLTESKEADRLAKYVDRLIVSPEFVEHQVNEFDWMLMQGSGSLRDYLTRAFREERSWETIFRELLLADALDAKEEKPPVEFVKTRARDLDQLTNDVSSLFFGVNISCAQCHDHPLVKDWKQDHFYGLKSFVSRTFENGGFIGERDYGTVSFLTPKGESRQAKLMFLSGKLIDEPAAQEPDNQAKKKEQELLKQLADKKQPPPKPSYSRRAKLVEVALQPDQRQFFARSIVNRIWYRLMGHGLVMPVDQMHSANPASHPELLEHLAADMAEHNFDLSRLIRGIVLSKAYGRDSRWREEARPDASLFAVAHARPLTPYQYGASLRVATTHPANWTAAKNEQELAKRIADTARSGRSWANSFQPVDDNFQVGVSESLMLANDSRVLNDFLGEAGLVGHVKTLQNVEEQVDCVVNMILCREPSSEERAVIAEYINRRQDRTLDAWRQVVWSFITGSEFRFNY